MPGNGVKNDNDVSLYPDIQVNFVAEGALNAGNTPVTLNVFSTLATKVGNRGHVANDGAGDFTIAVSSNGTTFNTAWTIKSGEVYDMTGMNVKLIRITRVSADSAYRVMMW